MFAKFFAAIVRPVRSALGRFIQPEVEAQMSQVLESEAFLYRAIGFLMLEKHSTFLADEVSKGIPLPPLAALMAQTIDLDRLGKCVPLRRLADQIVDGGHIDYDVIAERAAKTIQPADVARHVDVDDIAERAAENIDLNEIAQNIDCNEIASCLDLSDLAGEFDMSTLAEEISVSDIAGELDYTELARALLQQFVDADEARRKVEVRPSAS